MPTIDIESTIANWDGKTADDIRTVHTNHFPSQAYLNLLFDYLARRQHTTAVTWLLKAAIEADYQPGARQAGIIYSCLPELDHWEDVLHILQCMERVPVPARQKKRIHDFLLRALSHKKTFVRAWAYSGLWFLSAQYPELRRETLQLLQAARQNEPASVQARIRRVTGDKR